MNGVESMKYVPQTTASVWMPFKQTCNEESGDADFDSFKTAPWDAGGTQGDRFHEVMCRTIVHKFDRWTTRNTERELTTKMLMDTNYPRLTMTPGECDASYGGTQIGGDLHDTSAIPDGYTRRKDDSNLRRSAVCDEIGISAEMNCTAVELNDMTFLRRRLPRRQDSAEHDECYISVSAGRGEIVVFLNVDYTAVELYEVVFRRRRLPRREVFAECVEEKCTSPRTDSVSAEQNNLTFRRPKSPRRDVSTEQDMNCVSANGINGDSTASEPYDHLCRRRSLPPNRAVVEVGGSVHKHITFFRRTSFPPNEPAGGRNDDYIWLTSESNQSVCARPVTGSLCSGQLYGLHSLYCLESGTLPPNCNYQQTVVYIAPDYCCSHHTWCIEGYAVRSSITVILIAWYCIGVFRLRAMASDDSADREESGSSYAPSGPLPGTYLRPALDIRSDSLYELAPELQDVMGLRAVRPDAAVTKVMSIRNSRCIRVVTPDDHVTCGYHEILLHDMGDEDLKRKECKERFGFTQSGNCTHCGKYIQMDLGKHIAFYHMRRTHKLPLSAKAANLAKYFPAWTVSRVEWSKFLPHFPTHCPRWGKSFCAGCLRYPRNIVTVPQMFHTILLILFPTGRSIKQGTLVVVSAACRTRGATAGGFGVLRKRFSACKSSKSRSMRNTVFSNATTGDHSSFCRFRPAASAPWSVKLSGPTLFHSSLTGVLSVVDFHLCVVPVVVASGFRPPAGFVVPEATSGPGCRESPSPVQPYPSWHLTHCQPTG